MTAVPELPGRSPVVSVLTAADMPRVPGRLLTPAELREWVAEFATREDLWERHVAHDTGGRHFVSLYRDTTVDVWLLCWNIVDDTGWHDHDVSSGAVAVTRGTIHESWLSLAPTPSGRELSAGETVCFGPDYIHRFVGSVDGSVSIHAYSPPLWRLGQYSVDADGRLSRHSVSYAEELRPIDPVG